MSFTLLYEDLSSGMPGLYLSGIVQLVANSDAVLWDGRWLVIVLHASPSPMHCSLLVR